MGENFQILAFEFWNSCGLISRVAENLGLLAGESGGEFDDSGWREWRRIGRFSPEYFKILAGNFLEWERISEFSSSNFEILAG